MTESKNTSLMNLVTELLANEMDSEAVVAYAWGQKQERRKQMKWRRKVRSKEIKKTPATTKRMKIHVLCGQARASWVDVSCLDEGAEVSGINSAHGGSSCCGSSCSSVSFDASFNGLYNSSAYDRSISS